MIVGVGPLRHTQFVSVGGGIARILGRENRVAVL